MKRTWLAVFAAAATFASAIGLVTTGGWLISEAALRPPLLTLQVAIVSVRAFGIARGSFRWFERVVSHDAALHETVERRARLWIALAEAGPRGAWTLRRGDAITRLMQDAEVLQDRVTRVVVPATAAAMTAVGAVLLQARLQPVAGACFAAALVIAGVVVPVLTQRNELAAAREGLLERAELNARLSELVAHRDEFRALGLVDDMVREVAAIDARRLRIDVRAARLAGLTQGCALLASGLAIVGALLASVPAVLDGSLQGPHLAVVALLPWAASEVITALSAAATANVRVQSARRRLDVVAALQHRVPALRAADEAGLHVHGLTVAWDRAVVVRDVDIEAAPGQLVAVVGPSGAGKSSVVSALLGLVEYAGSVSVGGVDPDAPRATAITAVPQAPHMFRTTVRENLRLAAGPVEDATLVAVLERVGLATIPLDRDLSAAPLSGGEAQRLGLARALLTSAPVIVLDEPTEHLDDATAQAVMEVIRATTVERVVVLTTHRLTDLRAADHIVVLGDGAPECVGDFDHCLANSPWFAQSVRWRLDKAQVD